MELPKPRPAEEDEDAGGHYTTAGYALAGVGLLALLVALGAKLAGIELGFIDERSMAMIAGLMLATGASMLFAGRKR